MNLEHPIVLSASALESNKRIEYLIEAMALYGRGTLLIAGDGSQRDELLSLAIQKLKGRFVYLGPLSQEKLSEAYEMCRMLALLSIDEGFGLVLIEAMAHGKVVLAVKDMDREYIVQNGGILVDPCNIPEIAEAIRCLYKDSLEFWPADEAARFSWDKAIPQWTKLIEQLI